MLRTACNASLHISRTFFTSCSSTFVSALILASLMAVIKLFTFFWKPLLSLFRRKIDYDEKFTVSWHWNLVSLFLCWQWNIIVYLFINLDRRQSTFGLYITAYSLYFIYQNYQKPKETKNEITFVFVSRPLDVKYLLQR